MKQVIIMRGLPGSGKSTAAMNMHRIYKNTFLCSSDAFMVDENGDYKFDPTRLGYTHGECLKRFVRLIEKMKHEPDVKIIVDNTNITVAEIAPYYALAEAFEFEVHIDFFDTDIETSYERNTHGVPLSTIKRMAKTLETEILPSRWIQYVYPTFK